MSGRRLDGKVAVVTGGASGIGAATCSRMAAEGATVVVADIDAAAAHATAQRIAGTASSACFDAREPSSVKELMDGVVARLGRLDVLHNNAGRVEPDDDMVADADLDVWDRTYALNIRGYVAGCKYALPHMVRAGSGSIIMTASAAAFGGAFKQTAYGSMKAAVIAFVRYVATQYSPLGVRCNAISPGPIRTQRMESGAGAEATMATIVRHLPVGRLGVPDDVAGVAAFLASDDASFVTGQVINCDGGMLSHLPHVPDFEAYRVASRDPVVPTSGS